VAPERVVLIRHGQSQWNAEGRWQGHGGPGLTTRGRRQAALTARFLAAHESDVRIVISSDLARAIETAAPAADALGVPTRTDARLREIDVGWWSGLTTTQIARRDPETLEALRDGHDVPRGGAETVRELRHRVVDGLVDLASTCGGTMLVFSHGGPVRSVVGDALGLSVAQQRALAGPGNCSRTLLTCHVGRARLLGYNETAHLQGPETSAD
jgi:probable phosphoglycerate mutase